MGKKQKGSSAGSRGKPNWTPYLAVLSVVVVLAAFYLALSAAPSGNRSSSVSKSPSRSAADLEGELTRLHAGLSGVAGRGGSGLFGKIQAMADQAKAILTQAAAAPSEAERHRILEEGLSSKASWMMTLQDHALGLKKDGDDEGAKGGAAPQAGGSVVALGRENFTKFVAANPHTIVEFYTPWCPHCVKFAPEFAACAEGFAGRVAFAAVNGEQERQLTRVYGVGGYPTLKWMVHGQAVEYEGPRTKEKLAEWIEERLKPAYVDLESIEDAAKALDQGGTGNQAAKICAGEGTKGSPQFQAFVAAAEHFRGKMIFTWSPLAAADSEGSLRLHATGLAPNVCGARAGVVPNASACSSAAEAIAWLKERLDVDPDLQE